MRHRKSVRDKRAKAQRDKEFWFRNCYWCKTCSCTISKSTLTKIPAVHYAVGMEVIEKCIHCKKETNS